MTGFDHRFLTALWQPPSGRAYLGNISQLHRRDKARGHPTAFVAAYRPWPSSSNLNRTSEFPLKPKPARCLQDLPCEARGIQELRPARLLLRHVRTRNCQTCILESRVQHRRFVQPILATLGVALKLRYMEGSTTAPPFTVGLVIQAV